MGADVHPHPDLGDDRRAGQRSGVVDVSVNVADSV
jgi:hypothetical protein